MTTSQQDTTCPVEGHGMMVPCGTDFAYAPAGSYNEIEARTARGARKHPRTVEAVVLWDKPGDSMEAAIYSPSEVLRDLLFERTTSGSLGNWIASNRASEKLFEFSDLVAGLEGCYRIDDRRSGHMWTYMIWTAKRTRKDEDSLLPQTVYHFYPDKDEHEFPRLESFDEVNALLRDPSVLLITDVGGSAGKSTEGPESKAKWDLDDRVVVWDLGAIYGAN